MKMASKEDQLHAEALIVKWVSESLRPFTTVEDGGFVDLCSFLCWLRGQFKVPTRNKTRYQMMDLQNGLQCVILTSLAFSFSFSLLHIWTPDIYMYQHSNAHIIAMQKKKQSINIIEYHFNQMKTQM